MDYLSFSITLKSFIYLPNLNFIPALPLLPYPYCPTPPALPLLPYPHVLTLPALPFPSRHLPVLHLPVLPLPALPYPHALTLLLYSSCHTPPFPTPPCPIPPCPTPHALPLLPYLSCPTPPFPTPPCPIPSCPVLHALPLLVLHLFAHPSLPYPSLPCPSLPYPSCPTPTCHTSHALPSLFSSLSLPYPSLISTVLLYHAPAMSPLYSCPTLPLSIICPIFCTIPLTSEEYFKTITITITIEQSMIFHYLIQTMFVSFLIIVYLCMYYVLLSCNFISFICFTPISHHHSYFSQQQKPSYTTYPPPSFVNYYLVRKEICLIDNYCTLTLPYDNG